MRVELRGSFTPVRPILHTRCMNMKQFLSLLLALLMTLSFACAETTQEAIIVTVNGEDLPYSEYINIESAYLYQYESAGVDLTDAATYAYLQDLALSYAIEQLLVKQDMQAQGCYNFDAETEAWFQEQGAAAYEQALLDVEDMMREALSLLPEDDARVYALAYAENLGVNEQTYVDFYRTQYASEKYHEWLIRDNPITDEDVQSTYQQRVEESKALYANDVAAFETAAATGAEVWYTPAGYRSVLQILLPAEGATAEEKLANVQSTVDAIVTHLESGEAFETLIREYGADTAFNDEAFFSAGYQVHQESIIWEDAFVAAAFSPEMAQPGCWSKPFASDLGVHILYYLNDAVSGPVALTEEIADALSYLIYAERYTAAQTERINELVDAAEIVFH